MRVDARREARGARLGAGAQACISEDGKTSVPWTLKTKATVRARASRPLGEGKLALMEPEREKVFAPTI